MDPYRYNWYRSLSIVTILITIIRIVAKVCIQAKVNIVDHGNKNFRYTIFTIIILMCDAVHRKDVSLLKSFCIHEPEIVIIVMINKAS